MSDETTADPVPPVPGPDPEKPASNRGGRPTKLTPEIQKAICDSIRSTKLPIQEAAHILGISPTTIFEWISRGKTEKRGRYAEFSKAIAAARAEGTQVLLARIAKAGMQNEHWQANSTLLSMTEPHLAPKVRVEVGKQLGAALERITARFSDRPAVLEEILEAISGTEDEER